MSQKTRHDIRPERGSRLCFCLEANQISFCSQSLNQFLGQTVQTHVRASRRRDYITIKVLPALPFTLATVGRLV